MNIYTLLGVPVIGELSPNTKKEKKVICDKCNKRESVFSDIEYVFDRWNGEDIIGALAEYFITQKLKEKLEERKIKGYKVTLIQTSFSKQRGGVNKFGKGAYQKELPMFYHFEIIGKAKGDIEKWYEVLKVFEECGHKMELFTDEGAESMSNPELIGEDVENPLPRNVYKNSWEKDDLFLLQDNLNMPIVTQNFVDILIELGVKINKKGGVWLRPTNWIDEEGNVIG